MLWFTWALVGLFDVRFVSDSIFDRLARAGHLAVMVGFAVVAGDFHPDHQHAQPFQTMSLCLMVSRAILALQYASVVWHVRTYRRAKLPLAMMAIIHFAFAMVYLGISYTFRDVHSFVYLAWYVLSVAETVVNIGMSVGFDVLSFKGTHLVKRMVLLTLIIMGEGIIVLCRAVLVVQQSSAWSTWTPDLWLLSLQVTTDTLLANATIRAGHVGSRHSVSGMDALQRLAAKQGAVLVQTAVVVTATLPLPPRHRPVCRWVRPVHHVVENKRDKQLWPSGVLAPRGDCQWLLCFANHYQTRGLVERQRACVRSLHKVSSTL